MQLSSLGVIFSKLNRNTFYFFLSTFTLEILVWGLNLTFLASQQVLPTHNLPKSFHLAAMFSLPMTSSPRRFSPHQTPPSAFPEIIPTLTQGKGPTFLSLHGQGQTSLGKPVDRGMHLPITDPSSSNALPVLVS